MSSIVAQSVKGEAKIDLKIKIGVCLKTTLSNGSLLLDAVLIPVEEPTCHSESLVHSTQCIERVRTARSERDRALCLTKHYRNMAEETHREKRDLQHRLEAQVELVRNFWRSHILVI